MEHIGKILDDMNLSLEQIEAHRKVLVDNYYLASILRIFNRVEEFVTTKGQPICNIPSIWNICEVANCTPIQLFDALQKGNIYVFTEKTAQEFCWDFDRILDPQNGLIRVQQNLYILWT